MTKLLQHCCQCYHIVITLLSVWPHCYDTTGCVTTLLQHCCQCNHMVTTLLSVWPNCYDTVVSLIALLRHCCQSGRIDTTLLSVWPPLHFITGCFVDGIEIMSDFHTQRLANRDLVVRITMTKYNGFANVVPIPCNVTIYFKLQCLNPNNINNVTKIGNPKSYFFKRQSDTP